MHADQEVGTDADRILSRDRDPDSDIVDHTIDNK